MTPTSSFLRSITTKKSLVFPPSSPPYSDRQRVFSSYVASSTMFLVGIDELAQTIKRNDERYRAASERSWEINAALIRCQMTRENITSCVDPITAAAAAATIVDVDAHLDKLIAATIGCNDMYDNIVHENNNDTATGTTVEAVHPRAPRLGSLGHKMEDYARYKAFQHFLLHGKMISIHADFLTSTTTDVVSAVVPSQQSSRNILTDEEYICGVCIGLCHDLAKHCVQLASNAVHDPNAVPFINTSRDAVSAILEELLQFDFRNGPIRRKYDSVKYALKTIETVLYELSVAGAVGGHSHLLVTNDETKKVHEAKKIKVNDNEDVKYESYNVSMKDDDDEGMRQNGMSLIIPVTEIAEIRERFDHRDQQRETLIKACRDGQKSAKQAIFALHRGDYGRAIKLLQECEACVNDQLLPIIKDEPSLRYGSYSSLLEEYVEGILFFTWLQPNTEDTTTTTTTSTTTPSGKILLPVEIPLTISTEEYLGGLCDLTGEIGRYAVSRGTVRDRDGVQLCLEANKSIYNALKLLGKLPSNINKKMSMVNQGVEKLERLLYEQSLMLMTGRKEFNSSVEENSGFGDNDTNVAEEK